MVIHPGANNGGRYVSSERFHGLSERPRHTAPQNYYCTIVFYKYIVLYVDIILETVHGFLARHRSKLINNNNYYCPAACSLHKSMYAKWFCSLLNNKNVIQYHTIALVDHALYYQYNILLNTQYIKLDFFIIKFI